MNGANVTSFSRLGHPYGARGKKCAPHGFNCEAWVLSGAWRNRVWRTLEEGSHRNPAAIVDLDNGGRGWKAGDKKSILYSEEAAQRHVMPKWSLQVILPRSLPVN